MQYLDHWQVAEALNYPQLIEGLRAAFREQQIQVPPRHHHHYTYSRRRDGENTLLLMPAWEADGYLGVKTVVVAPDNIDEPSIQGQYALYEAATGTPRIIMDAAALTARRTAAASALAADYLAPADARTLLMVGTGTLAPQLIHAHTSVRPIERILIWGRDHGKAQALAQSLQCEAYATEACTDLEKSVHRADIVSCATLSKTPLLHGDWLRPDQHIDLVGAYRPDMREADDTLIKRVALYADALPQALAETGDLAIPIASGQLNPESVRGDLPSLCRNPAPLPRAQDSITCFKSVGHALEDLVAARLVYDRHRHSMAASGPD